ncbi:hypothetical protein M407DRAFT_116626 [Tulasnella calospora MUT 4182]|uniref:Uncharacterized protein n=1 Tax=Tulasnella calospora MUT 4182 TaxID=1051891 RepID=A0A0C3QD57_9AGAM|nr:hypothetical protein M407DRAFT_116626 [Tulasnella calospora MUT 4182]
MCERCILKPIWTDAERGRPLPTVILQPLIGSNMDPSSSRPVAETSATYTSSPTQAVGA